jgi:hypothetical protein
MVKKHFGKRHKNVLFPGIGENCSLNTGMRFFFWLGALLGRVLTCVTAGGLHALASNVPAGQSKKHPGLGRHLLSLSWVHGCISISEVPQGCLQGKHWGLEKDEHVPDRYSLLARQEDASLQGVHSREFDSVVPGQVLLMA